MVLKLAHGLEQSHPVHQSMVHMAEYLADISDGTMQIDIYPGAQLGGERELMELLQIGSLAMTKASASPMESFIPAYRIFSVPYVFRDEDHLWRVLEGPIGHDMLTAGDEVRLRGLTFYGSGSRNFYTTDQMVSQPSDLAGQKIRVQASQTSIDMVRALGGSATPIPWAELYSALQQGVVDGAENNLPSYYLSNHYQVAPLLSMTEHTFVPDVLIMGLPTWQRLSAQQQKWVQQAADESSRYQRELWEQAVADALVKLEAAGLTTLYPDKIPFERASVRLHESYRGTAVGDLIEAIKATE